MTRIAILCPTRGRPEQCRRMIESVRKTAFRPDNILLAALVEMNDPRLIDYADIGVISRAGTQEVMKKDEESPTVHKWNWLAHQTYQHEDVKLFMLAADDMIFTTPGWDTALIEHYEALKEKVHVYALQDSRDTNGTPHPIVTREYIKALGYAFPPIFLHWWVDSWTVDIGKSCGVFTHLKDYLLTHIKPSDTGAGDETHNRIRRQGWHERDQYVNDTCQHFLQYETKRLDDYLRKREVA